MMPFSLAIPAPIPVLPALTVGFAPIAVIVVVSVLVGFLAWAISARRAKRPVPPPTPRPLAAFPRSATRRDDESLAA